MRKTIIANWKMNFSIKQAKDFIKQLPQTKNKVIIAAPSTFLVSLKNTKASLSAQNVAKFESGAYTGEISAKMLKEAGCKYCLVGHSERRIYFGETDNEINQKIKQLLKYKLKPVLCVGENKDQKNKGLTKNVLKLQLKTALQGIKDPQNVLIAYEPVWAISTFAKGKKKQAADFTDIIFAHDYIGDVLKESYKDKASLIKILYGGTVNPQNAQEILSLKQVDGALVGGAALKSSSFNAIIKSIN